jgi:hypothetical protein
MRARDRPSPVPPSRVVTPTVPSRGITLAGIGKLAEIPKDGATGAIDGQSYAARLGLRPKLVDRELNDVCDGDDFMDPIADLRLAREQFLQLPACVHELRDSRPCCFSVSSPLQPPTRRSQSAAVPRETVRERKGHVEHDASLRPRVGFVPGPQGVTTVLTLSF